MVRSPAHSKHDVIGPQLATTLVRRRQPPLRRLWQEISDLIKIARRERLLMFLSILLLLMISGSLVFFFAEQASNERVETYGDALYWSVISVTTVGYGDLAPETLAGRIGSAVMLLSFMILMPLVGATITSIYVTKQIKGESGLERINATGHIVICGWNNNCHNILTALGGLRISDEVVIVAEIPTDHFENIAEVHGELDLHFVRGPYSSDATLQRANISKARVAIVLINYGLDSTLRSDELAVMTVLTLREMGPSLQIVSECFASGYRGHLRRAGANRVIVSGELDGFMLTAAALSPGLDTSIKDALSFGGGSDLWTILIPPEFVGRPFKELALHWLDEQSIILIGLISSRQRVGIEDVLGGDQGSIDEFILRHFELAGKGHAGTQHTHFLNPGPGHLIRPDDLAIVIYPSEQTDEQPE